jgi:hypothetical protein
MVVELAGCGKSLPAVLDLALKRLLPSVDTRMPNQIAGCGEALAAAFVLALIGPLASVCPHVCCKIGQAAKALAADLANPRLLSWKKKEFIHVQRNPIHKNTRPCVTEVF